MLKKLLMMTLAMLLVLTGIPFSFAEEEEINEDLTIETVAPEDPVVTEGEYIRAAAEYLADENITRYTAELKNNPTFSDGSPLTAQDVLFSLYVYLDPGYSGEAALKDLNIVGLKSYLLQIPEAHIKAAAELMPLIHAAGEDHVCTDADAWNETQQRFYWEAYNEYAAACEAEFPQCAQAIVDACAEMLQSDFRPPFGLTAEQIAADESLRIAYAMVQWGYADADGSTLTARYTDKVWNLEESKPTVNDFAAELSFAYDGDLAACWAIETSGTYEPALPNLYDTFAVAYSIAIETGAIGSISGIRMIDESKLEIDIVGIDMYSAGALFGMPVLSLSAVGNGETWNPGLGQYGHPFGDVSAIETTGFAGPILLEVSEEISF